MRKWNNVGKAQVEVLSWVRRVPKTREYIEQRFGSRAGDIIESLVTRAFVRLVDGQFHITDHGKAVLLSPDQYKRWRQQWGMSA